MCKLFNKMIVNERMPEISKYIEDNYEDIDAIVSIKTKEEPNETPSKPKSSVRYSRAITPPDESNKKFSLKDPHASIFHNYQESIFLNRTFVEKMREYIKDKGFTEASVYKAAQIDRRLFSKIMSDSNYKPSKDTCISLCVGLKLEYAEAKDMLSRAGYVLSHSIKRDVILEYCLKEKITDIDVINEILYRYEEKILGR